MNRIRQLLWPVVLLVLAGFTAARGAPVSEAEAVAAADVWYAMEINTGQVRLDSAERSERLQSMPMREVLYLISADSLLSTRPADRPVLAYVVKYEPHTFVVVAGDDRMSPIVAFGTESDFSWEDPARNFLRHFIGTAVPLKWQQLGAATDRRWLRLRTKLGMDLRKARFDTDDVYLVWNTALWDQWPYYNDTCVAHNGSNYVPAGCVATALVIKMKFHEWPATGTGSHSYLDLWGGITYAHLVNYGATAYDWGEMPLTSLSAPNHEVARVMYHAGVSLESDYELGGTSAYFYRWEHALNDHFRYKDADHSDGNHVGRTRSSVLARSPVLWGGANHAVVVDGYREPAPDDSFFHVNAGYSGSRTGWYSVDYMPSGGSGGGPVQENDAFGVPVNWIYVATDGGGSSEDGSIPYPFDLLSEGQSQTPTGGWLLIKAGTYTGSGNVPITFQTAKTMVSYNAGTANVDHKLTLTRQGRIDLVGNGQLKIY